MAIRIEQEGASAATLVIEFRYADYRLELDDREKAEQLHKQLLLALGKKRPQAGPPPTLPKFYR